MRFSFLICFGTSRLVQANAEGPPALFTSCVLPTFAIAGRNAWHLEHTIIGFLQFWRLRLIDRSSLPLSVFIPVPVCKPFRPAPFSDHRLFILPAGKGSNADFFPKSLQKGTMLVGIGWDELTTRGWFHLRSVGDFIETSDRAA